MKEIKKVIIVLAVAMALTFTGCVTNGTSEEEKEARRETVKELVVAIADLSAQVTLLIVDDRLPTASECTQLSEAVITLVPLIAKLSTDSDHKLELVDQITNIVAPLAGTGCVFIPAIDLTED